MGRSLKKGPYIDEKLYGRIEELNRTRQKRVLKTWSRRIALDRGAGAVTLRETFELSRAAPVTLVFMTPRRPDTAQAGVVALPAEGGRTVLLRFDARALRAEVEPLALGDPGLKHEWGETLYRVELASTQPLAAGDLAVTIATKESN